MDSTFKLKRCGDCSSLSFIKKSVNSLPIKLVDYKDKDDDFSEANGEDTLTFLIDFKAIDSKGFKKWTMLVSDSFPDEIDITEIKRQEPYTHFVRMWWD